MTENHVENYCSRTELLLRMLDGDLAAGVSEKIREEIRRILRCDPEPPQLTAQPLAEADE